MKKLTPVIVRDLSHLDKLAENHKLHLTSYPELSSQKELVVQAYTDYDTNCGNPWLITSPIICEKLKAGLLSHYSSPPGSIDYFDKITNLSPDVCPMCGGFKPFTKDHLLPKADYQAWSIFSKNLVPACDCNLKRGSALKGDAATQARVLHPYYDQFLSDRLLSCKITPRNNFKFFDLKLVFITPEHPEIASIKFHTHNIVIKSGVEKWLKGQLGKLKIKPSNVIQTLPRRKQVTKVDVIEALEDCLERYDEQTGTCNNWHSILCHGLLNSEGMLGWLMEMHNNAL